jgi:hypothetical protein
MFFWFRWLILVSTVGDDWDVFYVRLFNTLLIKGCVHHHDAETGIELPISKKKNWPSDKQIGHQEFKDSLFQTVNANKIHCLIVQSPTNLCSNPAKAYGHFSL